MKHLNNYYKFLICLVIMTLFIEINTDIPTHCVKSQIVGEWVFKRTPAVKRTLNELYSEEVLCGHSLPSDEKSSMRVTNLNKYQLGEEIKVKLSNDDSITFISGDHNNEAGTWTMVYDEGFDMVVNKDDPSKNISYFAFLKYDLKKSGSRVTSRYASYCYVTLNGWYHVGDKWGCFQGHKVLGEYEEYDVETNGESENKQNITEDSIAPEVRNKKDSKLDSVFYSDSYTNSNSENNSVKYSRVGSNTYEGSYYPNRETIIDDQLNIYKTNNNNNLFSSFDNMSNSSSDFHHDETPDYSGYRRPAYTRSFNSEFSTFKFTQTQVKEKLTLHSKFTDHAKFVERINNADLSWTATVYKKFHGKTIKELNSYAGKNKSRYGTNEIEGENSADNLFLLGNAGYTVNKSRKKKNFLKSFLVSNKFRNTVQKTLDYSGLMGDIRSQGSCGSCYAASTLTMLEARFRKKYPDTKLNPYMRISLDHIMECSVYNQGCDGGYSYLVMKFGYENELAYDKCYDKGNNCSSSCTTYRKTSNKTADTALLDKKMAIENYYYVGGSYGKCDEKAMVEELEKNGPFVVSFEPPYDFMHYQAGIYESKVAKRNWMNVNNAVKPEWQKVDHSVVLVGYGEENGLKYWKLQNSWGKDWGEDGFFRMVRGKDHTGIESICEAGTVVLK
jgi:C1A family cysteine protease